VLGNWADAVVAAAATPEKILAAHSAVWAARVSGFAAVPTLALRRCWLQNGILSAISPMFEITFSGTSS